MMNLNIHIYPSNIKFESRIEKISNSLINHNIFDYIHIIGWGGSCENRALTSRVFVRLFGRRGNRGGFIGKTFNFVLWCIFVYREYSSKQISCINAHSLSCLPLSWILKKKTGAVLVYDTHELETEVKTSRHVRRLVLKFLERILIKRVDECFVVSESIANWYEKKYLIKRPNVVLNVPVYCEVDKTDYFRRHFVILNNKKIFVHHGMLTEGRGIDLLLDVFAKFSDDNKAIVLMGYGPLVEKIKEFSERFGNIFYHPAVHQDDLLGILSSADFGISMIEKLCLSYDYCMPNKLFEYMSVGLPVVVSNTREMSQFVLKHECGLVARDFSADVVSKTLDDITKANVEEMSRNAKEIFKSCSWKNQESVLLYAYNKLIKKEV